MHDFLEKFESKLMPIAEGISRNKYLVSIRDGFLVSMPLLVVGSIIMLISNFPIPAWMELMSTTMVNGVALSSWLGSATQATFSVMSVFVVLGIGYNFSKRLEVEPLFGGAVAVGSCSCLLLPLLRQKAQLKPYWLTVFLLTGLVQKESSSELFVRLLQFISISE